MIHGPSIARLLLAASLSASASAQPVSGTVFSTIRHSEWCPAGAVLLDLATGRFSLVPAKARRNCGDAATPRPIEEGTLDAEPLDAVRKAYATALAEGLTDQVCREGKAPRRIVVSNGGKPTMLLTSPNRTEAAPEDRSCWSPAADALRDALERSFTAR